MESAGSANGPVRMAGSSTRSASAQAMVRSSDVAGCHGSCAPATPPAIRSTERYASIFMVCMDSGARRQRGADGNGGAKFRKHVPLLDGLIHGVQVGATSVCCILRQLHQHQL